MYFNNTNKVCRICGRAIENDKKICTCCEETFALCDMEDYINIEFDDEILKSRSPTLVKGTILW